MSRQVTKNAKRKRLCFILRVKKELLSEYKKKHKKIWPEMLELITKAGISNYSIFLRNDGLMVNYFESADLNESFRIAQSSPIYTRWQQAMAKYFEARSGDLSKKDAGAPLEEIFYLD